MKKVLVVMGGFSSEKEISLLSGQSVAKALTEAGYHVVPYVLTENIADFIQILIREKPDAVFNALHGKYGEDGCIQGLLNLMKIPYTHSGVMASAIGMNKEMTRFLMEKAGVPIASGGLFFSADVGRGKMPKLPYVVKPNDEGSSLGVTIVRTKEDESALLKKWPADKKMLVESYVPGRELSVVVMGDEAVGVVEILPKRGYYDFDNKYTAGATEHLIPAPISAETEAFVKKAALTAHRTFGCRGVSRSDFRLDDKTNASCPKAVFLEINTNPGMTAFSLVPEVFRICCGVSYCDLVSRLVEDASCEK